MIKKTKRSVAIILCISLLMTICPMVIAANESDPDLPNYCPYNEWAVQAGKDNKMIFLEEIRRETKRWEMASLLYYALDKEAHSNSQSNFTDLSSLEQKYIERIEVVSKNGAISGYQDSTFKPFENITRAEFCSMIVRTKLIEEKKSKSSTPFIDTNGHWGKEYIQIISDNEIMYGKEESKFYPDEHITIQEIFVVLDRMVKKDILDKNTLIEALTNTFKCKQYGEKEAYIIETMYSKFDEVQKNMKFFWFFDDVYDTSVYNGYATYDDMVKVWQMCDRQTNLNFDEYYAYAQEILPRILGYDDINAMLPVTLSFKDLIYVMVNRIADVRGTDTSGLKFTNINEIAISDAEYLTLAVDKYKIIENVEYYLPFENGKVSRYMLTYTLYNYMKEYNPIKEVQGGLSYTGKFEIQTDLNGMPSNYTDFPYILKDVPKEVYEKDFFYTGIYKIETPKVCYNLYSLVYSQVLDMTKEYYDLILNVDYNTMDVEKFTKQVKEYASRDTDVEDIRKYAQYVIDNKIILKGSGYSIPGTMYIADIFSFTRVIIDFEIVSATENKNLLLGDFLNYTDVIYTNKKYELCFDANVRSVMVLDSWIWDYYIFVSPIIRDLYWYDSSINQF